MDPTSSGVQVAGENVYLEDCVLDSVEMSVETLCVSSESGGR